GISKVLYQKETERNSRDPDSPCPDDWQGVLGVAAPSRQAERADQRSYNGDRALSCGRVRSATSADKASKSEVEPRAWSERCDRNADNCDRDPRRVHEGTSECEANPLSSETKKRDEENENHDGPGERDTGGRIR